MITTTTTTPKSNEITGESNRPPPPTSIILAPTAMHHSSDNSSASYRSCFYYLTVLFFVAISTAAVYLCNIHFFSIPSEIPNGLVAVSVPPPGDRGSVSEDVRLDRVLKEAAMDDNTVILTTLNAAWASPDSIFDLFLESFVVGEGTLRLLDHLVIVALDREAYDRCKSVHRYCFGLATPEMDFSGQKNFMSEGYLKMMWRRIDFLRTVLEKGYDFIFTDTDILWFRDPLPQFSPYGDFQISCDHFSGKPLDLSNRPNGGFKYVKSNNRTIEFYKFWYSSRLKYPRQHDQDVLNFIKYSPFLRQIGFHMVFLDTTYFGGLCEPSKDLNKVCTMHVNCCIGLSRKVQDLRAMLEDWRSFRSLPSSIKNSHLASWSVPKNCSLEPI